MEIRLTTGACWLVQSGPYYDSKLTLSVLLNSSMYSNEYFSFYNIFCINTLFLERNSSHINSTSYFLYIDGLAALFLNSGSFGTKWDVAILHHVFLHIGLYGNQKRWQMCVERLPGVTVKAVKKCERLLINGTASLLVCRISGVMKRRKKQSFWVELWIILSF